ncbi:replication-relaxation family protein [Anaerobacillus sp. MEB173]|uniref:replication-relaxation family protein n=1 Tax=Anaerobacillus sp. MEB173 TaxID=3383345 RepID=UPI003F8DA059
MILWRGIRISKKESEILEILYDFRCSTNELLRILIFGHLKSKPKGQKDNISRYTSSLRKKKLIQSESCYPYSRELIFYLTAKGVEFVKEHLNIDPNNKMAGFGREYYGEFDAKTLKPPLKNIEHTMMFLKFVAKNPNQIRHNLYAVKEYEYLRQDAYHSTIEKGKVRPDGEYLSENNRIYSIEIDTGSERTEALISKFNNYRRLFDEYRTKNKPLPWAGILFVCKPSTLTIENDRRIKSIFEAASKGLQSYCWLIPVIIINRTENKVNLKNLLLQQSDIITKLGITIPEKNNFPSSNVQQHTEIQKKEGNDDIDFLTKRFERDAELKKQQEKERILREAEEQQNKHKGFGWGGFYSKGKKL